MCVCVSSVAPEQRLRFNLICRGFSRNTRVVKNFPVPLFIFLPKSSFEELGYSRHNIHILVLLNHLILLSSVSFIAVAQVSCVCNHDAD